MALVTTLPAHHRRAILQMRPGEYHWPTYAEMVELATLVRERPDLVTLDSMRGHLLTPEGERVWREVAG